MDTVIATYPKAVEGESTGPGGVVLVEWTGLTDDLMGAPTRGLVTADMLQRLTAALATR